MDTTSQEDCILLESERSALQVKIESQIRANRKRRDAIKSFKKKLAHIQDKINCQISAYQDLSSDYRTDFSLASKISQEEGRALNNAFNRVFGAVFTVLPSEQEMSKPNADSDKKIRIRVNYDNDIATLPIEYSTTFLDLRESASKYWKLPTDIIFFCDEEQSIYPLQENVFQSLHFWGNLTLKNHKPMVHILISTEVLENSRYDIQPVQENLIHEETPMVSFSQLPRQPQEKTTEQIMEERFARRVKGSSIINIVKTALFLALFGLWCALLYSERDVASTSWMNRYLKNTYYSFIEMKRYGEEDYRRFIVGEVLYIQFNDIWEIINNIQNAIFAYKSYPSPGVKILRYASLRQIRTRTYECREGGQNLTCYESKIYIDFDGYNVDKEKYGDGEDGFEFEDKDTAYYISGKLHSYPMYGHTAYISTHDLNNWHETYLKLKTHNWIDAGTRAVFITLNFVNPNVNMISVAVICIEIGHGGNLIATFVVKSVDYSIYDPASVVLNVIIIALLVIEWVLVGRDLFKSVEEIDYLALKYLPNKVVLFRHSRDMIRSWEQYDKKPMCKRLRMPYFGEGLILVSFLIISIVQMCKLIWYHTEFEPELHFDDTEYVNLYSISEDYNWIVNIDCFITLFFGISMVQYTLIWIHDISIYSTMLSMSIREIGWYIIACIPCVIAFIALFYETLGPFEYAYSSLDRAFLGVLSTFLGDWKISGSYANHVWLGMVVISFAMLLLSKGALYIAQVLNIQWHLMEARNIIIPNENYRSLRKKQEALLENGIKLDGPN